MQSMLSNCNEIKLENNNRKISGKFPSIWRLNDILLNKPWVKEEIKWEIRKYSEVNKNVLKSIQKFVGCHYNST